MCGFRHFRAAFSHGVSPFTILFVGTWYLICLDLTVGFHATSRPQPLMQASAKAEVTVYRKCTGNDTSQIHLSSPARTEHLGIQAIDTRGTEVTS